MTEIHQTTPATAYKADRALCMQAFTKSDTKDVDVSPGDGPVMAFYRSSPISVGHVWQTLRRNLAPFLKT